MDYDAIAEAGGIPKPTRKKKEPKGMKKSRLKNKYKPIPSEVKLAALEKQGGFCMGGHCFVCGGTARVGIRDDAHHFPHRSQGGKDTVEHLWLCRHECHMEIHANPSLEKEMFHEMEAAGLKVVWRVEPK